MEKSGSCARGLFVSRPNLLGAPRQRTFSLCCSQGLLHRAKGQFRAVGESSSEAFVSLIDPVMEESRK